MSNYTKTTDFEAKDSLPTGDSGKIIRGAEFETEFDAIATAITTKADTAGPTFTGTLTFETISDGSINVTAFVDEDNMASDSATLVPTQQSVKAYVDSVTTELNAQDLDFQADLGGALNIDLDTETMTFTGGTGIDTSGSGNTVTFDIDSTVTTLTGTQTLTNKTLTAPVISGNLTTDGTIDGRDVATDGAKLDGIEAGATADQTDAEIRAAVEAATDSNVFTDADHTKLDGIEASATADQTDAEIRAAVEAATDSNVFTDADHTKLDGIEASATADQTDAEIRAAVEAATDSNVFTDADHTKLDGIEALADVTDTTNVTAAGALMDSELTNLTAVKSLDQGVATTDSPTFAGLTTTADVSFGDNDKAIFGAGSDLQIYHDGSNSFIADVGTGNLGIRAENLFLQNADGSANYATASLNGAFTLSYNNSIKLATTNTGIDVTGSVTADGLTVANTAVIAGDFDGGTAATYIRLQDDTDNFLFGSNNSLGNFLIKNETADALRLSVANTGDISFYEDTGTTAKFFWDASAESLGIGTSSPAENLHISSSSGSARIRMTSADGSDNMIVFGDASDSATGAIRFDHSDNSLAFYGFNNTERMRIRSDGNVLIGKTADDNTTAGHRFHANGFTSHAVTSDSMYLNRLSTDGAVLTLAKDGTTVGSIQSRAGLVSTIILDPRSGSLGTGITGSGANLSPTNGSGTEVDARNDIGTSTYRFKDLHLSGTAYVATSIGIGTSSPATKLEVTGTGDAETGVTTTHTRSGVGYTLILDNLTNAASNGSGVKWRSGGFDTGAIITRSDSTAASNDAPAFMTFHTSDDGTENLAERMRIDSSGNLLVSGTEANPAQNNTTDAISLHNAGLLRASTTNAAAPLDLNVKSRNGDIATFRKDGTTVGSIGTAGGDLTINGQGGIGVLQAGGTGQFAWASNLFYPITDNAKDLGTSSFRFKDLYLSGGVQFGTTGAAAQNLDDYEEGTWTPVLVGSTTAGTATFVTGPIGTYTKIGNQVTVYFDWNISAHTGTGALRITGLPFALGSGVGVGAIMDGNYTYSAGRTKLVPYVVSSSILRIYQTGDGLGYTENVLDTAHQINGSVTYQTA